MLYWPHPVTSLLVSEIVEAVSDPKWQEFRLTLKGKSTSDKLSALNWYRSIHFERGSILPRKYQVQIDNYINALKRGGQLDKNACIPGIVSPTTKIVPYTPFVMARTRVTNVSGDLIEMVRASKKYSWYTFVSFTSNDGVPGFHAIKYDENGEPQGQYTLNERGTQCSCPATVPFCRHKEMLVKFKATNRIDSGWTYCKELDQWKEPISLEGLID